MFIYIETSLSSLIFSTTLNKKNGIRITLISKFKKLEIYNSNSEDTIPINKIDIERNTD
jgi:hypothetical protein